MSQVFSNAAIERIARVVQLPARDGRALAAADFVHRALEEDLSGRLRDLTLESMTGMFWFGDDREPELRFVSFAGFLELGTQAGYLSLEGWEGAAALEEAVSAYLDPQPAEGGVMDLGLLAALSRRFAEGDLAPQAAEDDAFASFESYLHLASRVRSDGAAMTFLDHTHTAETFPVRVERDRAALLSPRHFAEAFATGAVAGVEATSVAAGVSVLRWFEWLAEILDALDPESALRAGIVRHARWAQDAARVQGRFDMWADQMAEWTERPAAARADWSARAERLFGRLAAEQERLAMAGRAPAEEREQPEKAAVEIDLETPVEERIGQLVAEGRTAAARELVLAAAEQRLQRLRPTAPDWLERVEALVEDARTLVRLGSADAAAALVAPVIPTLTERYGRSGSRVVADAREIVARARQGSAPEEKGQERPGPATQAGTSLPEAETPRYQERPDERLLT